MKKSIIFFASVVLTLQVHANNSVASEVSHVAGGALLAGGVTAIADQFPEYKPNRAMLGFGVSTVIGVIDFAVESVVNGDTSGQLLDLASHTLGSALGAWVTDEYILSPVITNSKTEGKYAGLTMNYSF